MLVNDFFLNIITRGLCIYRLSKFTWLLLISSSYIDRLALGVDCLIICLWTMESLLLTSAIFIWNCVIKTTFQKKVTIESICLHLVVQERQLRIDLMWMLSNISFFLLFLPAAFFLSSFFLRANDGIDFMKWWHFSVPAPSASMWTLLHWVHLGQALWFYLDFFTITMRVSPFFISIVGDKSHTTTLLYEAITRFPHLSTQELDYYLIKQCDCTIIN